MTVAFLVITVASVWLAAWGYARLSTAYDRLHCVTFCGVSAGVSLVVMAFAADGISDRALKVLLLVTLMLVSGAAVEHAVGRAIAYREAAGERS